jgi:hypothetical protein
MKKKFGYYMTAAAVIIGLLLSTAACTLNGLGSDGNDTAARTAVGGVPSINDAAAKFRSAYQLSSTMMLFGILSKKPVPNGGPVTGTVNGDQGGSGTLVWEILQNNSTGEKTFKADYTWNNYKTADVILAGNEVSSYTSTAGGAAFAAIDFTYAGITGTVVRNITLNVAGWPCGGTYTITYNGETQVRDFYFSLIK